MLFRSLQSIADVESIVISYETYALVRDIVSARALPPVALKGIGREVVPYLVEGLLDASGEQVQVLSEHTPGLTLYLDLNMVDANASGHVRDVLRGALSALEKSEFAGKLTDT